MTSFAPRGMSIDGTRLRKDSAPMATTVGRFIRVRIPFAPRLLSSAVIARPGRLSSFLSAFHVRERASYSDSNQWATRGEWRDRWACCG